MATILIIDDEPDIRTYFAAVLEDNGFETWDFDGGSVTADQAAALNPDLILLDIMMPQRSGISIYTDLRRCGALSNVPIILMTGISLTRDFNEQEFKRLIRERTVSPPDKFLEKPIKKDELLATVRDFVSEK